MVPGVTAYSSGYGGTGDIRIYFVSFEDEQGVFVDPDLCG